MRKGIVASIIPLVFRLLISAIGFTWRDRHFVHTQLNDGYIYTLWHRYIIPLTYLYRKKNIGIVISQSSDGELINRVVQKLGFAPVRGSSSRGGGAALRQIVKRLRKGDVMAITPDGPRGPIYKADKGVAYASLVSGKAVVPVYVCARPAILLKTWDRMLIPLPFARVEVHIEEPIFPEQDEDVDRYLKRIERRLQELEDRCPE